MPALSYYRNVYGTAVAILEEKGFQIWRSGDDYCCEKDGWDFWAEDPVQLLGLVSIFESVGPTEYREYWWRMSHERELSTTKPEFVSVYQKDGQHE